MLSRDLQSPTSLQQRQKTTTNRGDSPTRAPKRIGGRRRVSPTRMILHIPLFLVSHTSHMAQSLMHHQYMNDTTTQRMAIDHKTYLKRQPCENDGLRLVSCPLSLAD